MFSRLPNRLVSPKEWQVVGDQFWVSTDLQMITISGLPGDIFRIAMEMVFAHRLISTLSSQVDGTF
jgi:hypothetical protein